jgi:hypothetical protein
MPSQDRQVPPRPRSQWSHHVFVAEIVVDIPNSWTVQRLRSRKLGGGRLRRRLSLLVLKRRSNFHQSSHSRFFPSFLVGLQFQHKVRPRSSPTLDTKPRSDPMSASPHTDSMSARTQPHKIWIRVRRASWRRTAVGSVVGESILFGWEVERRGNRWAYWWCRLPGVNSPG